MLCVISPFTHWLTRSSTACFQLFDRRSRWAWDKRHEWEQHLCFLLGFAPVDRERLSAAHFLYNKRDKFNFHITNFPFLSSNITSALRKFYGRYIDLIKNYDAPSPKCYITFWDIIILFTPSIDQTFHLIVTVLPNWTLSPFFDVITLFQDFSIGHLQRVQLANRGRLLLWTPVPVPYGTCICSNVETIYSWTCHVYRPFEFRTALGAW